MEDAPILKPLTTHPSHALGTNPTSRCVTGRAQAPNSLPSTKPNALPRASETPALQPTALPTRASLTHQLHPPTEKAQQDIPPTAAGNVPAQPSPPSPTATYEFTFRSLSAKFGQQDCEAYVRSLPPSTIDLFVTSPPYFIGKDYDLSTQLDDFETTIAAILPHIATALKPSGSLCWQLGNHVSSSGIIPLDICASNAMRRSTSFQLRNRIIWVYSHGPHARRRFSGRHETILWYTKGQDYYFDLDAVRIPQKYPGKRHYKGPHKGAFSGNPHGKNPGDYWEIGATWEIPNVKANHIEKTAHPCQFPLALVQRLVLALCPRNGVVLDPFMGSGTTALAALLNGRSFLGCDTSSHYLEIAAERIRALKAGTLKYRRDEPIHGPFPNHQVAITPDHFSIQEKSSDE